MPTTQKKKKRPGKGARARERRKKKEAEQAEAALEKEQAKAALEKAKSELLLKRGDPVRTVPSDAFSKPVTLTIANMTWNPNREDWMISFVESNVGTGHAWYKNYQKSYYKVGEELPLPHPRLTAAQEAERERLWWMEGSIP